MPEPSGCGRSGGRGRLKPVGRSYILPPAGPGGPVDGVERLLHRGAFGKVRSGWRAACDLIQEFPRFDDLQIVEAQLVAGGRKKVRIAAMLGTRAYGSEALDSGRIGRPVDVQLVESLLGEADCAGASTQFELQLHFPAGSHPVAFRGPRCSALEAQNRPTYILDPDGSRLLLPGPRRTLRNCSMDIAEHRGDRSCQEPRHGEDMAAEIRHGTTPFIRIRAPAAGSRGVRHVVLGVQAPEEPDLANFTLADQVARELHDRVGEILEADPCPHAAGCGRSGHLPRRGAAWRERFLAIHMLSSRRGRQRDRAMQMVGRRDRDQADRGVVDEGPPVAAGSCESPLASRFIGPCRGRVDEVRQVKSHRDVEDARCVREGDRVRKPHESGADDSDADGQGRCVHGDSLPDWGLRGPVPTGQSVPGRVPAAGGGHAGMAGIVALAGGFASCRRRTLRRSASCRGAGDAVFFAWMLARGPGMQNDGRKTMPKTVRLTMSQALVRHLAAQRIETEGEVMPLFAGVFAIFGHGNVTCLGEALEAAQDQLPTWRGQNEQSMALAAIGFAKARRRRQIMVAASSIGPGATNMVTAAGVAHSNRLPLLLLAGETFANRRPDPVLQQVEHFGNPSTTVNDAFRAVCRYWDRIAHPEQILSSLPQAISMMLDPGDCGPALLSLCQDTQEIAFDCPAAFLEPRTHCIPRPRPDRMALAAAADVLRSASRPLVIAGGGVRYSMAEAELAAFAERHQLPVAETIAGRSTLVHGHSCNVGPIGVIGSASANALAREADVVLAIGTRLQDFTTGSWTAFSHDARFVTINAARFDAVKHRAVAVVADAREAVSELGEALGDWRSSAAWANRGRDEFVAWNRLVDDACRPTNAPVPTYAQAIGAVNRKCGERDLVLTAAGGLPGELNKVWRAKSPYTFDCEFGFSCMGYEIAGGWGAAMADPDRDVIVMVGDGSYMMMNSDIYSSVLTGHKMILVVCDNGGFAVINRLQNGKGNASFNNLIRDCRVKEPVAVDFAAHAASMGALSRSVGSVAELEEAIDWAKGNDRTTVVTITTDAFAWTPGDAWWDVGVPEVSEREEVRAARLEQGKSRAAQRVGV